MDVEPCAGVVEYFRWPPLDRSRHTIIYLPDPTVGVRGILRQVSHTLWMVEHIAGHTWSHNDHSPNPLA